MTLEAKQERWERERHEVERVLLETNGQVGGIDGAAACMGINRTNGPRCGRVSRDWVHHRYNRCPTNRKSKHVLNGELDLALGPGL